MANFPMHPEYLRTMSNKIENPDWPESAVGSDIYLEWLTQGTNDSRLNESRPWLQNDPDIKNTFREFLAYMQAISDDPITEQPMQDQELADLMPNIVKNEYGDWRSAYEGYLALMNKFLAAAKGSESEQRLHQPGTTHFESVDEGVIELYQRANKKIYALKWQYDQLV